MSYEQSDVLIDAQTHLRRAFIELNRALLCTDNNNINVVNAIRLAQQALSLAESLESNAND